MKRPKSHVKESESRAYVGLTLKEWVLNPLTSDYGIDFDIQIVENEVGTDLTFEAQVKSTESPNMDETHFKFRLDTKHIDDYFKRRRPVLLIVYYIPEEIAYWVVMQEYVWDILNKEKPNWLSQKSSTIKIPLQNVLTDKDGIKEAVRRCYARITVDRLTRLSIVDGLGLNDTLDDIKKHEEFEEKAEFVLNNGRLLHAQKLALTGDFEAVFKKLEKVYSQKKNDLTHISSIIGIISYSNIRDKEENRAIVRLADEGLQIAQQIGEKTGYAILLIFRAQAQHLLIIQRIAENLIAKKSMENSDLGPFIVEEANRRLEELSDALNKIPLEVRNALQVLKTSKEYYILIYLLTIVLTMAMTTISHVGFIVGREKFEEEIKVNDVLAQDLLSAIEVFKDEQLELYIRESVAGYYYFTRNGNESLEVIEPALSIAVNRKDQPQIEKIKSMIHSFKTKPDPYYIEPLIIEDLTMTKLTEMTKAIIESVGEDLNDGSDTSYALNLGLKDMDPESYLRFCEELYIHYVSTSALGQQFRVPSIGNKLLWCKHSNVTINYRLEIGFETHKENHCKDCKHRKPRSEDWVCTVRWFSDREVPEPIQKFKENMMKW